MLYPRDHMEAETAAAALRAAGLHPRIALDNTLGLGAGLTSNSGRRILFVAASEAKKARSILGEPRIDDREDRPVLRLVMIVAFLVGLLLLSPLVARACYGT